MKKIISASILSFILLGSVISFALPAKADFAVTGGSGGTIKVLNSNEIQMMEETVNIDIYRQTKVYQDYGLQGSLMKDGSNPFGYVTVDVSYVFQNTSDKKVEVQMSFPESCQGNCFEPTKAQGNFSGHIGYKLADFKAFENGKEIKTVFNEDPKLKNDKNATPINNWYSFSTSFDIGEKKKIRNTYWVIPTQYNRFNFQYILNTGSSWKGSIGKADVYARFHDDYTIYDAGRITPDGYYYDKKNNSIVWHFENFEPTEKDNINISYNYIGHGTKGSGMCLVSDAMASSYYPSEKYKDENGNEWPRNYFGCMIGDNSFSTSWVEGVSGSGIGEWVDAVVYDGNSPTKYEKLAIFTGLGISQDLWQKNNRVKKLKLTFSDKSEQIVNLEDKFGVQILDIQKPFIVGSEKQTIRATIMDVYRGTTYDDTAISEIQFLGLPSNARFVSDSDSSVNKVIEKDNNINKEANNSEQTKKQKSFLAEKWYYVVAGALVLAILVVIAILYIRKKRNITIK